MSDQTVASEVGVRVDPSARSCFTCPSAVTSAQFQAGVGARIGGPVCSLKLLPITRPDQKTSAKTKSAAAVAAGCDSYGKPRVQFSDEAFTVPAPIEVGFGDALTGDDIKVNDCRQCINFVDASDVRKETGWNAGLCRAKGILLLTDRYTNYAKACEVPNRWRGNNPRADLRYFMFNPEYQAEFGKVNVAGTAKKFRETEPADWPTDRPVSSKAVARGIKAWRAIPDPEDYSGPVYLPVYDRSRFDQHLQDIVPKTGSDEHPELYTDHDGLTFQVAVLWRDLDMTPALWGIPGTGKTELYRYLAWLMQLPFHRFSITGSTELDDLAGKWEYTKDKGTYFQYGRLPLAWKSPGVICLDEPNTGPPDVWQFLRPLTDNSKQLILDTSRGEHVDRHDDAYFGMALNPAWDARNVGAQTIGDADARRLMHIVVDVPPKDVERDIIIRWCKTASDYDPTPHLNNVMQISDDIRKLSDDGDLPITWGLANNIKVTRAMKRFPPLKAYQLSVLNYLDPAVSMQVSEVIRSIYPS